MGWSLNNVTAPDTAPTKASTVDAYQLVDHIVLDVVNSSIFWQVKRINSGGTRTVQTMGTWNDPTFMLPGSRVIDRENIVGFRFWAAVTTANLPAGGSQARVTAEGVDP